MFLDKSQEKQKPVVFQDIKVGLIPSWIRLVFLFFFDEHGILNYEGLTHVLSLKHYDTL